MYSSGYVFTRIGKGVMHQTRSVRIDLSKFELSSENRRVLRKIEIEGITNPTAVALPTPEYDMTVAKLAKDFYTTKFGPGIMSAQKIKEILTEPHKSNFNCILTYSKLASQDQNTDKKIASKTLGYSICYASKDILHYSYPFYSLNDSPKEMGMGMMLYAIQYAKSTGMKYIYLGSLQRKSDTYKLQFEGLEWFDGKKWSTDIDSVREFLRTSADIDV